MNTTVILSVILECIFVLFMLIYGHLGLEPSFRKNSGNIDLMKSIPKTMLN